MLPTRRELLRFAWSSRSCFCSRHDSIKKLPFFYRQMATTPRKATPKHPMHEGKTWRIGMAGCTTLSATWTYINTTFCWLASVTTLETLERSAMLCELATLQSFVLKRSKNWSLVLSLAVWLLQHELKIRWNRWDPLWAESRQDTTCSPSSPEHIQVPWQVPWPSESRPWQQPRRFCAANRFIFDGQ